MSLQTPLAKVRGLGSAKEGVHHWWAQRVSGAALAPLTLWFVFSVATNAGASYEGWTAWMADPFNTVLMIAFVLTSFHHGHLGLQVVVEDYIPEEGLKLILVTVIKWLSVLLSIASTLAILKVAI